MKQKQIKGSKTALQTTTWISLLAILLSSCCTTSSTRVPPGYPYDPEISEVNFSYYLGDLVQGLSSQVSVTDDLTLIDDTLALETFIRKVYAGYHCNVDFSNYSIIVSNSVTSNRESAIQTRVLFDFRDKVCAIETRSNYNSCGASGTAGSSGRSTYTTSTEHRLLMVPKLPGGFRIDRKLY